MAKTLHRPPNQRTTQPGAEDSQGNQDNPDLDESAATATATEPTSPVRAAKNVDPERYITKKNPNRRLKATKYPITDPITGAKVLAARSKMIRGVTTWMESQIAAGLVVEVSGDEVED